jgi:ankyrin repeat protein
MGKKLDLRGVKDVDGDTTLHIAAGKGFLEICRFLVEESGIDVNVVSKTGACMCHQEVSTLFLLSQRCHWSPCRCDTNVIRRTRGECPGYEVPS